MTFCVISNDQITDEIGNLIKNKSKYSTVGFELNLNEYKIFLELKDSYMSKLRGFSIEEKKEWSDSMLQKIKIKKATNVIQVFGFLLSCNQKVRLRGERITDEKYVVWVKGF